MVGSSFLVLTNIFYELKLKKNYFILHKEKFGNTNHARKIFFAVEW